MFIKGAILLLATLAVVGFVGRLLPGGRVPGPYCPDCGKRRPCGCKSRRGRS